MSPLERQQLAITLESRGYEILEAGDGEAGIECIKQHDKIDLIISDINMPVMDGLTMIKAIKEDNLFTGPIMILTTEGDKMVVEEGKKLGAACWLVKPFDPATLEVALDRLLS